MTLLFIFVLWTNTLGQSQFLFITIKHSIAVFAPNIATGKHLQLLNPAVGNGRAVWACKQCCSSQLVFLKSYPQYLSWWVRVEVQWEQKKGRIFIFNWWQISTFIYCIFHATRQHAVTSKLKETFHSISYCQQVEQAHRGETGPIQRRVENHHLRKNLSQVNRGCLTGEGREEVDVISFLKPLASFCNCSM